MYTSALSNIQPTRYTFTNHKYIYYSISPTCFDLLGHHQWYQLIPYDGHQYYEHLVCCIIFLRVSQNSLHSYSKLFGMLRLYGSKVEALSGMADGGN